MGHERPGAWLPIEAERSELGCGDAVFRLISGVANVRSARCAGWPWLCAQGQSTGVWQLWESP